jgi:diamine N-acetyltransferase
MPNVTIRRAAPADAEALSSLGARTFAEAFGHLYPPEDLAAFLAEAHGPERAMADLMDPRRAVWIAETAGEPVGYALAGPCELPHPDVGEACGELKRLYLRTAWQNSGAGARLFEAAEAWLLAQGATSLWIGVWSENVGAQRFYARRGYRKVGEYDFPVGRALDREFILRRP